MVNKFALLIGINYSSNRDISLDGCIDDVENIQTVLIEQYQYNASNIKTLRDDANDNAMLPTYANIMKSFTHIIEQSETADEIWIHYSGHGTQIYNDAISYDDVIVPMDYETAGYIFDTQIHDFIKGIKNTAILVFDCCHSGSLGKLPWSFIVQDSNIITIDNSSEVMPNPNIYFLSGCRDSETSSDTFSRELSEGVGAFSNALNVCLKEKKYNIDILTLYKNICNKLNVEGFKQHPVLSSTTNAPKYAFVSKPPE